MDPSRLVNNAASLLHGDEGQLLCRRGNSSGAPIHELIDGSNAHAASEHMVFQIVVVKVNI